MTEFMIIDNQVPEQALTTLKEHNKGFLAWANVENIEIETVDQQKNLEDLLIIGRRAQKDVDAELKRYTDPIRAAEKAVRDIFKPYQSLLDLVMGRMNQSVSAWHLKMSKEAEAARIEAMKAQAVQIAEAKETGEIIEFPTEVKTVEKTSHTHAGTVTYRKDFDIQVVNPDLVPRDLCEPSLPKIRARVKSGVLEIPGCLITEKTITVTRAG
jgi:hypothetical protein